MKKKKRKITAIVITSLVLLLIAFRIALPHLVTDYVNKVFSEMEGFDGFIDGVDINLYRGAYEIHNLDIYSVEKDIESPFVLIDTIDISVEWKALFDGSIVSEIIFIRPELNFIVDPKTNKVETGEENDWTKTVTDLVPLEINSLTIHNGKVSYIDNTLSPKLNLYFENMELVAKNLTNAKDIGDSLPSPIIAQATSIGGGTFDLKMKINILKQVPDFDLNAKLEGVHVPALNDFFQAYASVDAEAGDFDLFTEIALVDSVFTGYVKPVVKDLKLLKWSEEKEGFFGKLWEGIASLGKEVVENRKTDQIGSKVPLNGRIENVTADPWDAIWSLLKNAFFKPLQNELDQSIRVNAKTEIVQEE